MTTVGFAGMTHLGIVSATAIAARGFEVIGYDPNEATIGRLVGGDLIVTEPDLPALRAEAGTRLRVTADIADLGRCDLVYISTDVPTDDRGSSDLSGIDALVDRVRAALRDDAVLVVLCQVPPGYTRAIDRDPARLYYQVETLVFGRAVERATRPERYIVGCADPDADLPPALLEVLGAFDCPVLAMRYESAELAKIAINCCLVAHITTANTLAELCERIGADWSEIAPALRLDRRIGAHAYLAPGLGLAGGNLERDLATVQRLAERHGTDAAMVDAWVANSARRRLWPFQVLEESILAEIAAPVVGVLGLAYKENTHSTKNSPSLALLEKLKGRATARVHDPVVPPSTVPWAEGVADPLGVADGADVVVIATPWPLYRDLDPAEIARRMRGRLLVDPYGVLADRDPSAAGLDWRQLGVSAVRD